MHWVFAIGSGLVIGTVSGGFSERLSIPPVAQTVMAVLAAFVLTATLIAWQWAVKNRGRGYVGIGLDSLAWLVGAGVIGAAIHVATDAIGPALPMLMNHRPMILGAAAGLYVGWASARAEARLDRLTGIESL